MGISSAKSASSKKSSVHLIPHADPSVVFFITQSMIRLNRPLTSRVIVWPLILHWMQYLTVLWSMYCFCRRAWWSLQYVVEFHTHAASTKDVSMGTVKGFFKVCKVYSQFSLLFCAQLDDVSESEYMVCAAPSFSNFSKLSLFLSYHLFCCRW